MDHSTRRVAIPVALGVELSGAFLGAQQETALHAGTLFKGVTLAELPKLAVLARPVARVVTEAAYAENAGLIDSIAEAVGARVVRLRDEKIDSIQLEARLVAAVLASSRFGAPR